MDVRLNNMVLYKNLHELRQLVEDFCLHCRIEGGDIIEIGDKNTEYGSWYAESAFKFSPVLYVKINGKWLNANDYQNKFTPIGWSSKEPFFVGRKLTLDERTMLCPSNLSEEMFDSPMLCEAELVKHTGHKRGELPKNCKPYHDGFVVDVGMGQFGIAYQFNPDAFGESGIVYKKLCKVPILKRLRGEFGDNGLEFLGVSQQFADIAVKYGVLDTELSGVRKLESSVCGQEVFNFVEMCIDEGLSMSEGLLFMGG